MSVRPGLGPFDQITIEEGTLQNTKLPKSWVTLSSKQTNTQVTPTNDHKGSHQTKNGSITSPLFLKLLFLFSCLDYQGLQTVSSFSSCHPHCHLGKEYHEIGKLLWRQILFWGNVFVALSIELHVAQSTCKASKVTIFLPKSNLIPHILTQYSISDAKMDIGIGFHINRALVLYLPNLAFQTKSGNCSGYSN